MQANHSFDISGAIQIGFAVRVLCVSGQSGSQLPARLGAFGAMVDMESEVYAALSTVIDDPIGYSLLVVDCDTLAGDDVAATVQRTLRMVEARVPVMLISTAFPAQVFPDAREEPVRLRAPLSDLSLRVGYEHSLRDLVRWNPA